MGRIEGARGEMVGLDAQATAALVEAAADVALILDADGTVRDVAASAEAWTANAFRAWIGQPWESLVTSESRPKVREMLSLVGAGEPNARWRHINQLQPDGVEVPILFSLVRIAPDGRMVAIGRDLRPLAALQGRLMEAQQLMERDYSRLRRLENEYRTLFDLIRDPILIVRARDHVVMECNRAAGFFFGQDVASLKQTVFDQLIAPAAASATTMLLQQVSSLLPAAGIRHRLPGSHRAAQWPALLARGCLGLGGPAPCERWPGHHRQQGRHSACQPRLPGSNPGCTHRPDHRRVTQPMARPCQHRLAGHDQQPGPGWQRAALLHATDQ
jgi:PAS domain-containing protein